MSFGVAAVWDLQNVAPAAALKNHNEEPDPASESATPLSTMSDGVGEANATNGGSAGTIAETFPVVTIGNRRYVISRASDGTLKEHDLTRGFSVAMVLSSDGRRAVSAGLDRTVRLWDVWNGRHIAAFTADRPLDSCRFSPDGSTIFAKGSGVLHCLVLEGEERSGAK
jgi:WD40 repeat protein